MRYGIGLAKHHLGIVRIESMRDYDMDEQKRQSLAQSVALQLLRLTYAETAALSNNESRADAFLCHLGIDIHTTPSVSLMVGPAGLFREKLCIEVNVTTTQSDSKARPGCVYIERYRGG